MQSNTQAQLLLRPVVDDEGPHVGQQGEGHAGDLARVSRAVRHRQTGHHHVRVAHGLHLAEEIPVLKNTVRTKIKKIEGEKREVPRNTGCLKIRFNVGSHIQRNVESALEKYAEAALTCT